MTALLRARFRGALASTLLGFTLLLTGCASDDTEEAPREQARKNSPAKAPLPTLAGQETFLDGRITAEVKVGAMTGFNLGPRGSDDGDAEHGGGRRGHRGGGMGGGGMGGGGRREGGGGPGGDGPGPNSANPEQAQLRTARRADRMGAPPVMIHLRFTNTGADRVDLVIADFLSPLGNFVVTPEKLSLDPGQTVEVEPMTSRLAGEITGGEISLKLRAGNRQETKTITLQPEPGPAAPVPTPQP